MRVGDEFFQRLLVELAARDAAALGFALGLGEQFVGNGDGGFHTRSITEVIPEEKVVECRAASLIHGVGEALLNSATSTVLSGVEEGLCADVESSIALLCALRFAPYSDAIEHTVAAISFASIASPKLVPESGNR